MNVTIGVDVGGTTIAAGVVARDGRVMWATERPTHKGGPGTALAALMEVVDAASAEAKRRRLTVDALGVGLAGAVDVDRGVMVSDCNFIRELAEVPLARDLSSHVGVRCFVDNDVNALALGESRYGVGRGFRSMVILAIGTEVGAGIIVNEALVRGAHGWAGELGHVSINFDGPDCPNCGGRGCLSLYVGGRALADEARRRLVAGEASRLAGRVDGGPSAITSEAVFAAAREGDPLASALVEQACEALAAAVGGIVNGLNPQIIVVTGGVARSLVSLEKDVFRRAGRYAFARPLGDTRFCVVPGDKTLAVRGGAALALSELERVR